MVSGHVLVGANGAAGEIDYNLRALSDVGMTLDTRVPLEDMVSGQALARRAAEVHSAHDGQSGHDGQDCHGSRLSAADGGGLLAARDPLLTGWITERLAERAPAARPQVTDVPPIAGAALMGLDRAGAGPAAERRLRAAYQPA
ncbi:MAG TPA: hypothetical protein VG253_24320 [Streptosporangiaceae bacterium]|nr:hypothetical protein [Streptosporangiaceae bacterium]